MCNVTDSHKINEKKEHAVKNYLYLACDRTEQMFSSDTKGGGGLLYMKNISS